MKYRFFVLPVLLAMLVGLAACGEQATPVRPSTSSADRGGITLVPYTNQEFGMSGMVPDGWVELKPGQFQRHMPGNDPTLLGQVAFPGATAEQVAGTMGLPGPVGSVSTADLSGGFLSHTE